MGTAPWTLTMDDGACRLTGTGDTASDGQCTDLGGALALAPDVGANLGAAVGRVAIAPRPGCAFPPLPEPTQESAQAAAVPLARTSPGALVRTDPEVRMASRAWH